MDQFTALKSFVAVGEAQSFTEAARRLRITKSAVSRQVSDLESELGARLLHRTTRSLSLTEAGHAYFQRAARILADLEDANRAVEEMRAAPRGKLRVSAPMSFGYLHLMPAISDFLWRYPDVVVDLAMNDEFVESRGRGIRHRGPDHNATEFKSDLPHPRDCKAGDLRQSGISVCARRAQNAKRSEVSHLPLLQQHRFGARLALR